MRGSPAILAERGISRSEAEPLRLYGCTRVHEKREVGNLTLPRTRSQWRGSPQSARLCVEQAQGFTLLLFSLPENSLSPEVEKERSQTQTTARDVSAIAIENESRQSLRGMQSRPLPASVPSCCRG